MKERSGDQPLPTRNDVTMFQNGQVFHDIQGMVMDDINERRKVGISRYGTALQPFNGRDVLRDIYEELIDAACYVKRLMVERDTAERDMAALRTGVLAVPAACSTCQDKGWVAVRYGEDWEQEQCPDCPPDGPEQPDTTERWRQLAHEIVTDDVDALRARLSEDMPGVFRQPDTDGRGT